MHSIRPLGRPFLREASWWNRAPRRHVPIHSVPSTSTTHRSHSSTGTAFYGHAVRTSGALTGAHSIAAGRTVLAWNSRVFRVQRKASGRTSMSAARTMGKRTRPSVAGCGDGWLSNASAARTGCGRHPFRVETVPARPERRVKIPLLRPHSCCRLCRSRPLIWNGRRTSPRPANDCPPDQESLSK